MNEFRGTPGPWEVDGVEIRASASHPMERICEMAPGFSAEDANLIAAAPKLLEALRRMLDLDCPLTGDPSRAELIEHWEYEQSQGNGAAEDNLFALAVIAEALGEQP